MRSNDQSTITIPDSELRRLVRETVHETLTSIGFDVTEPTAIQADAQYLRKARTGSEEVSKWVKRSAISVGVTGALYAFVEGVKLGFK